MKHDALFWFVFTTLLIVFLILPDPIFHLYIEGSDFGLPPIVDTYYPNIIKQMAFWFPIGTFYYILALGTSIGMLDICLQRSNEKDESF